MHDQTVKEGKTIAIISYLTFIGTIIAFVMNQDKKNSFASFHIRQAGGLFILGFVTTFIKRFSYNDWFGNILAFGLLILWIIGFIGVIQGEEKRIPLLGDQFQQWFKNIG